MYSRWKPGGQNTSSLERHQTRWAFNHQQRILSNKYQILTKRYWDSIHVTIFARLQVDFAKRLAYNILQSFLVNWTCLLLSDRILVFFIESINNRFILSWLHLLLNPSPVYLPVKSPIEATTHRWSRGRSSLQRFGLNFKVDKIDLVFMDLSSPASLVFSWLK